MADVKISQLTTITPDLLDEIIVNDVVVGESKTTHRATLQDVRNLANQNIDDMSAGGGGAVADGDGSKVTGDLYVTGNIEFGEGLSDGTTTINDLSTLITEEELNILLEETTSNAVKKIDAKSAADRTAAGITLTDTFVPFRSLENGFDSTNTDPGFTYAVDTGILSAPFFSGDGSLLVNVDSAYHSQTSDYAIASTFAFTALDALRINTKDAEETDADYYPTFVGQVGIDSVNVDPQLTYNPSSGIFGGAATDVFFRGDGSLLENVEASGTPDANTTTVDALHSIMFRELATGDDSTNTDPSLLYNPVTNEISGLTETDLFMYGGSQWSKKTDSKQITGVDTNKYYLTFKRNLDDLDSVRTETSFFIQDDPNDVGIKTVYATAFSGDGSGLTDVTSASADRATLVGVTSATTETNVHYLHFGSISSGDDGVNASTNLILRPNTSKINVTSNTGSISFGVDSDVSITTSGIQYSFNVSNNGTSAYTFSDLNSVWFPSATDNPILYLRRGETYRFDMNITGHPFRIQSTSGLAGTPYNTGVTNNARTTLGSIFFRVPMSAPATLYYQCVNHTNMNNTINIV